MLFALVVALVAALGANRCYCGPRVETGKAEPAPSCCHESDGSDRAPVPAAPVTSDPCDHDGRCTCPHASHATKVPAAIVIAPPAMVFLAPLPVVAPRLDAAPRVALRIDRVPRPPPTPVANRCLLLN